MKLLVLLSKNTGVFHAWTGFAWKRAGTLCGSHVFDYASDDKWTLADVTCKRCLRIIEKDNAK